MTVFSLQGSKILTDLEGQITDVELTKLEAVTRIGTNTLDVAYLGDPENPHAISLSDYNLLFDKIHINDGDLPSRVDFFDLAASDGYSARVLNFVFETTFGTEERMFSVGSTPLPQFQNTSDASLFFAQHEPIKVTTQDAFSIRLDQIQNVEKSGVFVRSEISNSEIGKDDDGFDFVDLDALSDVDVWDVEFANAAQLQDAISVAFEQSPTNDDPESENRPDEKDTEIAPPSSVEFADG